jgi:hypothetical protein
MEQRTKTQLDDHKLEGAGNLPDEQLDLDQQAVTTTGTARLDKVTLGEDGRGRLEGIRDTLEVRGQGGRRGVLVREGWVVRGGSRGLV